MTKMELTTNDFIAAFGEELQTREYDEILAARDDEEEPSSDDEEEPSSDDEEEPSSDDEMMESLGFKKASNSDEIKKALGKESYQNLKALAKDKGIDLKDLAKSIGLSPKQVREGVRAGEQFPNTPGAFDAMCRQLGFEPSEARSYLGGIYEAQARGERIEARYTVNEKLNHMHDVLQKITDPATRKAAEAAIDGLWDFLNKLADSQS